MTFANRKTRACGERSLNDRRVACNRGVGHSGDHINYGPSGVVWSIWKRKNAHAVVLGRKGGKAGKGKTSEAKAVAARENGKKGGRPKNSDTQVKLMKRLIVTALLLLLASTVSAQSKTVAVYVTSAGAANGMTDPNKENQDTMKDLRDSLKGRKGIALVDAREQATIVLVVQSRTRAQLTADGITGSSGMRECVVRVQFLYKDLDTEMSGIGMGGALMTAGAWKQAAKGVAKQIEQWIDANRDKL